MSGRYGDKHTEWDHEGDSVMQPKQVSGVREALAKLIEAYDDNASAFETAHAVQQARDALATAMPEPEKLLYGAISNEDVLRHASHVAERATRAERRAVAAERKLATAMPESGEACDPPHDSAECKRCHPPAKPAAVQDVLWRIANEADQFLDGNGMIYLRWLGSLLGGPDESKPAADDMRAEPRLSENDLAVLQRLKDALPDVGVIGWHVGVEVLDKILAAPTAPALAVTDAMLKEMRDMANILDMSGPKGHKDDRVDIMWDVMTASSRHVREWVAALTPTTQQGEQADGS